MRRINFMNRKDLRDIGFNNADTIAFIDARTRAGTGDPKEMIDSILAALSSSARKKLKDIIAASPALADPSEDKPRLNAIALELVPVPQMLSEKKFHLEISFHRQVESELFEAKEPFTLRGPNRYEFQDISFEHLIHLRVRSEDNEQIAERVLAPEVANSATHFSQMWQASPPLGHPEKLGQDGTTLIGSLVVQTRRRAAQPSGKPVANTRFERNGRYQMIGDPQFRFDGYALSEALLTADDVNKLSDLLDTSDGASAASIQGHNTDPLLLETLSNYPLRYANIDFEGGFTIDREFDPSQTVIGWMWVLTGPDVIIGFQPDKRPEVPVHNILIPLGRGAASSTTKEVPYDVSENALLNRPDLFSDDPGTSCKPFNNPGRILGEKRFHTVLRVTQPKVAKAGETPIFFEEQEKRQVDYPRRGVDENNMVDYESDPTKFQAQTVALGHVLQHAVRYRSNGYSLGDVAYSLTLAPRQKRRIMKVDFARRERSQREELTSSDDEVMDALERERDYDNVVTSELGEWSRGRSQSSAAAAAAGFGGYLGTFVMGGGAVAGHSQSSASQEGGRNASARERQHLRDAIRRHGQSLRSLESTVVTETEQTESVEGVSEVVQNINYTRSLSVIYHEILRHLRVDTEIAGVSECIFVPMPIKPFTDARISRHRHTLSRYARGWLERSVYRYLDDIQDNFSDSDIPSGIRASHPLTELTGSLWLTMGINIPSEGPEFEEINANTDKEVYEREYVRLWENTFLSFGGLLPVPSPVVARKIVNASDAERERYFQNEIAPHMARTYLDSLELSSSQGGGVLEADFTLTGRYRYGRSVRVDFTVQTDGNLTREHLVNATLRIPTGIALPPRSYVNLTSARLRYATDYYSGSARSDSGTRDLVNPTNGQPDGSGANITFRLKNSDTMNLRNRLKEGYTELKKTLADNTFRYHKAIWWRMDRDELYTLLDGYAISDEDGRSLAAMAERRPVGIQGNCLVFQIKTDTPVDPQFATFSELRSHYESGLPPADPMRISLPTDGLYARALMDDCIAAEEHDGSFDWVFDNKEPALADFPSNMFDSRRAQPQNLQPTEMPNSIISLQNAPTAPGVSGLSDAFGAVQNGSGFRDITGLEGTQANLRMAMEGATNLATSFGGMAMQTKLAELQADAAAGKNLKAFAAANKKTVADGMQTEKAAIENTESYAKKQAEGAAAGTAKQVADNAKKILDGEDGGTQVSVNSDGAQVVHKEPRKPRPADPVASVSVVPIPPNQILFMNFKTASARLKGDHIRALEILAGEAGLDLDDVINIEGHTSRSGSNETNDALGRKRSTALFEKLHKLISPLGAPNFTPIYLSSTGEEGSYRERFSGIDAVRDAPGEGHPNDPVEKAVLFTFKNNVAVDSKPKVIDFFGVKITISGHFVFIDNKIIVTTPEKKVKIVDRSSHTVIKDNVVNETFTENNRDYSVNATDNAVVVKLDNAQIGQGASLVLNINSNNGKVSDVTQTSPTAATPQDEWKLKFYGPEIEAPRTLSSIIDDVADLFLGLSSSPAGTNSLFDSIATEAGTVDPVIDAAKDAFVDFLIDKIGLGPVKFLLNQIRFGTVKYKADIKVKSDNETKAKGTFAAPGIMIGTQSSAPSAVILNNAAYKTSQKLKVTDWDDQQERFREFSYLNNGFLPSVSALKEALEALVVLILPFLPTHVIVGPVSDGVDAAIATLSQVAGASGVRFKAFSGDTPISISDDQAGATGLEFQIIAMASGSISFS